MPSFLLSILQVNGLRVALPHSPSPLISLSLAGQYITLRTPFGLQVRWDGNHYAQISVPRLVWVTLCQRLTILSRFSKFVLF